MSAPQLPIHYYARIVAGTPKLPTCEGRDENGCTEPARYVVAYEDHNHRYSDGSHPYQASFLCAAHAAEAMGETERRQEADETGREEQNA